MAFIHRNTIMCEGQIDEFNMKSVLSLICKEYHIIIYFIK